MKLKFKIQQYQTDAVENVVRVFDGQPNLGLLVYKIDHGKVDGFETLMQLVNAE